MKELAETFYDKFSGCVTIIFENGKSPHIELNSTNNVSIETCRLNGMDEETKKEEKPIRLSAHAKSYCIDRGFSETEVVETIRSGNWQNADRNRLECRKEFAFKMNWNGNYYETKIVRPIFVEEDMEIVVITVYTYFY